jgi:hypothetical protein
MWHWSVFGLTTGRLLAVAWPVVAPASGGDEVAAAPAGARFSARLMAGMFNK